VATSTRTVNWFAIWVSVAVVVVLVALGGLVFWMNSSASDPGPQPAASNIDPDTGAISFGSGPDTVQTYIDFMCPFCGQFEEAEGTRIAELVDAGDITLEVHPVAILDRASQGTQYSSRAAAAMFSVAQADPAHAYAFMQAMYDNQPSEGTPGLTDEEIIGVARDAGVDVTAELEQSITDGEFLQFAQSLSLPDGVTGTPALFVNGEAVQVTYDPEADIVARLS
jgi:protein-disulfide isomerase